MWDSVNSVWTSFNSPLEGYLDFMYLDTKNLVTTGMGNLIDPRSTAEALPWYDKNTGEYCSIDEIDAAWDTVKSRTDLASHGGGAFKNVAPLRLTEQAIEALISSKLHEMESYLERRPPFTDFQIWPADAQLGLLSMAWGMGPAFKFPKFQSHASVRDWTGAADECRFNPDVGTIKIRNDRNQQLFRNAALVEELGLDPSELLWPNRAARSKGRDGFGCQPLSDATLASARGAAAFDLDLQFSVRPSGFTRGYGGPNTGGHQPPSWYIQYGMDLGGGTGTDVFAAFDGVVSKYQPHNPAADTTKVYGAQIFVRHPDYDHARMGAFYTHLASVPESIKVGESVSRGDYLGTVLQSPDPSVPPHLHLALVEIVGGLPGGQYLGVDVYSLFLELETIYSENFVTVRFMQDGTAPVVQWAGMRPGSQAVEPSVEVQGNTGARHVR
ncbi:MAG: M23 family metallopeptidase [Pseudonocardia sp.]|nr:MAG: M23 family metallopeptidase [Pseudonocardia sp.]